jgi:hypothetical protein
MQNKIMNKTDGRKKNGGARVNTGPKEKPIEEKKVSVTFTTKFKNLETTKVQVKKLLIEINAE